MRCVSISNGQSSNPIMVFTTVPPAGRQFYVDELAKTINEYRVQQGLPAIPVSPSLGYVAMRHVLDLDDNRPDAPPTCNAHSWSTVGPWSGCCYTSDHAQAACMWRKPQELTQYEGNGYEIAVTWTGGILSPQQALESWKGSPLHHEVILNAGPWDEKWNAMGGGLYRGYGAVWFGREVD